MSASNGYCTIGGRLNCQYNDHASSVGLYTKQFQPIKIEHLGSCEQFAPIRSSDSVKDRHFLDKRIKSFHINSRHFD